MIGVNIPRSTNGLIQSIVTQRMLAIAGIIAPVMFWVLSITAGLIRPGYDPIRQFGSELGIGPHAWLQNVNFILFGLLEIAFAYGLHRGINHGQGSRIGPALLTIGGMAMVLVGIFPMSIGPHTLHGSIHARAAQVLYYALPLAFFVIAPRLNEDRHWRGYSWYSALLGAIAFILATLLVWGLGPTWLATRMGLVQRLLFAVAFGWLEILALRLLALSSRQDTP